MCDSGNIEKYNGVGPNVDVLRYFENSIHRDPVYVQISLKVGINLYNILNCKNNAPCWICIFTSPEPLGSLVSL